MTAEPPASHRGARETDGIPTAPRSKHWTFTVVGLLVAAGLVWQASSASLAATTVSEGNSWQSGSVTLTDNDHGVALFTGADGDLAPGTGPARCIEVTYAGDVGAEVRLYLARLDDFGEDLGSLLTMKIETGSGSSCTSPGSWTQLSRTDMHATATAAGTWATGWTPGAWTPSGDHAETRPYRFTPILAGDNAAQGDRIEMDFVWEAHSI